jgi:NADPH:quinone reductase-like Zn-dependent oxidoreductase
MKAVRLNFAGGQAILTPGEEPTPVPGRNEVLMRVHAASLNYRDHAMITGGYPGRVRSGIPLSDAAGEVAAIGSGVTRVKIGDRVTANCLVHWIGGPKLPEYQASSIGLTIDGVLAEYVLLHENAFVHLPDYMNYCEGASLPCAAVSAWSALNVCTPLKPSDTVLIQGTGGVALFGLQIARTFNAKVLAITSSDAKAEQLKAMGASEVVNYREVPDWDREILRLTDGRGVDKVVEIGGGATLARSAAATRIGGEIGLVGFVSGLSGEFQAITILQRSLIIAAIGIGPRIGFEALLGAMAREKIRPVIDSVFPFVDYRAAYERIASGNHVGKVVIEMDC